jgi:hypothetical protein
LSIRSRSRGPRFSHAWLSRPWVMPLTLSIQSVYCLVVLYRPRRFV